MFSLALTPLLNALPVTSSLLRAVWPDHVS